MNRVSVSIANFGIEWDKHFFASSIPKSLQEQIEEVEVVLAASVSGNYPESEALNPAALAELQAAFRAAKVVTKTAVQPVPSRFDLLECDEPAEPVTIKPKWSAIPNVPTQHPQPAPQQRRTVEDILDLTTSGPLEALVALQIAKAEIVRDLWQRGAN